MSLGNSSSESDRSSGEERGLQHTAQGRGWGARAAALGARTLLRPAGPSALGSTLSLLPPERGEHAAAHPQSCAMTFLK